MTVTRWMTEASVQFPRRAEEFPVFHKQPDKTMGPAVSFTGHQGLFSPR